jgi:hypothetical protein
MKTINLVICILFAVLALLSLIIAIIQKVIVLYFMALILGSVAYVALQDYRDPIDL